MSSSASPRVWLTALALGVITSSLSVSSATVMSPLNLAQLTQQTDYVVRVRVTQTVVRRVGGRHISAHQLKLLKLYDKAPQTPAPLELTLETLGGSYQGLQQRVAGSPSVQVGEEVIMFLTCPQAGPQVTQHARVRCRLTGMGQGLWRSTQSETGEERWAPSVEGIIFTQTGAKVPSPHKPRPLQELLAQITKARQVADQGQR
jgi:hypothetical protein